MEENLGLRAVFPLFQAGGLEAWHGVLAYMSGLEVDGAHSSFLALSCQWPFTLLLQPHGPLLIVYPLLLPYPLSYSGFVDSRWPKLASSNRGKEGQL